MRGRIVLSDQPRQPWRQCPYCGVLHDGAMGVNPTAVVLDDGSALVCGDCGGLGVCDSTVEGGWRLPSGEERRAMLAVDHVRLAMAVTETIIDRRERGS